MRAVCRSMDACPRVRVLIIIVGCHKCELGKYGKTNGSCTTECESGRYSDGKGEKTCKNCPNDTWSDTTEATSNAQCTPSENDRTTGGLHGRTSRTACLCKKEVTYTAYRACVACPPPAPTVPSVTAPTSLLTFLPSPAIGEAQRRLPISSPV